MADVNGDGSPDVVVANAADGTVQLFPGSGSGTLLSGAQLAAVTDQPTLVAATDVNGDARPT